MGIVNTMKPAVPATHTSFDMDPKQISECQQIQEKMSLEERICRLCLKKCSNFKTIDGDIKDILNVLLPRIDITAIQEPVMCTLCAEVMFTSFDFKATCLSTHSYLFPLVKQKDDVKLNLRDIYVTKNQKDNSIPEDADICGLCMSPFKNCSAIFLDVRENDIVLKKKLEQCLPELDLYIIEKPLICAPCHASIEKYSLFVTNLLIVEDKIRKYMGTLKINSKTPINLNNLVSQVDENKGDIIKLEEVPCDYNEIVGEVEHKYNGGMDIDDPKFNNEQKFIPKNILDRKIEGKEICKVKIEEMLCGKDGMGFKEENFVEMENQKLHHEEIEIKTDELDFYRCEEGIFTAQQAVVTRLNGKQECFVLPNLEDNLLKPHTDQTFMKKNVAKITTYECEFCRYQTENKYSLKKHLLEHKNRIDVTLKIHLLKHKNVSEVTMYTCSSCVYQTIHKQALKIHLLKHKDISEVTMYKCDSCVYQTRYKRSLRAHLVKHRDIREVTMFKCDSCVYQTSRKQALKIHVLKHKDISEITMYKCDSCVYQTRYERALRNHLLKHRGIGEVTMYKCSSCVYQTRYKQAFKIHLLKHKDISEVTMYKCDSCVYQTRYELALRTHLVTHRDIGEVTMYKCSSCVYQTRYKQALNIHLLKHKDISEVTMYKCDSCVYQAINKQPLKNHLLNHKDISEVTMYKCDSCVYQTVYKQSLKRHLLKHKDISEVAMYKCDICEYETFSKENLKIHLLKHKDISEVTMYKCSSCVYQTRYKNALKIHLQKHKDISEVTMYKCDSCVYQTSRKQSFKNHLLKHKDISEVTMYK